MRSRPSSNGTHRCLLSTCGSHFANAPRKVRGIGLPIAGKATARVADAETFLWARRLRRKYTSLHVLSMLQPD
jgi:hypothetical protein